jgi:hypothetical protein
MKNLMKIVGINLIGILFFSLLLSVIENINMSTFGFMVFFLSSLTFFINILISIIMFCLGKNEFGKYYLVSAGVSIVVGTSSCLGVFRIH